MMDQRAAMSELVKRGIPQNTAMKFAFGIPFGVRGRRIKDDYVRIAREVLGDQVLSLIPERPETTSARYTESGNRIRSLSRDVARDFCVACADAGLNPNDELRKLISSIREDS